MLVFFLSHRPKVPQDNPQKSSHRPYPKPRVQIRGVQYTGTHKGEKTISIKADKFTIEKKKVGFFRFGMMNVVNLENAEIDVYGESMDRIGINEKNTPRQLVDSSTINNQLAQGLYIRHAFQKDSLPSFSVKRFSPIEIEPVCLRLHNEESQIAQITASSARMDMRNRDIVFKGNVCVISGQKVLAADRICLILENTTLITDGHFNLESSKKTIQGKDLQTDIFLNMIGSEVSLK